MRDIWVPLSGAIAQQNNIDVLANNVANSNTPGFKKDQAVFKEYLSELNHPSSPMDLPRKEWSPKDFYNSRGAEQGYVKTDGIYTIFKQGQLTPTGNPLDLAIWGNGLFEVLTPNGVRYTRKGTFTIAKNGELVTEQGYKVLSKGEIENKQITNPDDRILKMGDVGVLEGKISINREGEVRVNGKAIGNMALVEFKDLHTLKKEGNSLFINEDTDNILTGDPKSAIHQGMIEESNVEAVSEMSNLIKANRHFESIQRAIKNYDAISGRGVNDIARF